MSAFTMRINTIKDAHRAIHLYQQTGFEFRIPLITAVLDGRIAHFEVQRSGSVSELKRFMALAARRPTLVLIGDDDDEPTGPDGWPCAQRLLKWARVIVLHATGAERWHYETTVNTAEARGKVLMIETNSAQLPAWMAATKRWAPQAGVQVLQVQPGEPAHPTISTPRAVQ